ncbi:MAG: sulfatase-like hydrolase/transferase [Clostridiales Family XIII bacterium]|jgi:phosphoglycerol transferase MdoB-like AlkP superfamily enzyme|nr:sulfatase-like hydrolase/transferase [Clostridiales Family XIII bacterium]
MNLLKRHKDIQTEKPRKEKKRRFKRVHGFSEKIHNFVSRNKIMNKPYVQSGLIALVLMLIIEGFEYKGVFGGFIFLVRHPAPFAINYIVIFATLSIAWLFRRRVFFYFLISVPWLALGVTNGIILSYRMTPFTTADLQVAGVAFDILPSYFSPGQLALIGLGIVAVIALFVLLAIFGPKKRQRPNYKKAACGVLIAAILASGSWSFGVKTNLVASYFENLWDAYYDYGVPYCFITTWLRRGVPKPAHYNEEAVKNIFAGGELEKQTEYTNKPPEKNRPNIIFLQLESFIDPTEVKGLEFSQSPTPFFESLKESYSSGYLEVPVVGGGTANTELEAMSGMSMKYFGPGEYPYKTILETESCETMAYDMKMLGYSTHAIHNHRGAFYNRNLVFANLGFDDFTSLEYMNYVSKTPKNFAKDDVLIEEIFGALESTKDKKDYIYCISVQGHGKYPENKLIKDPTVSVSGGLTKEQQNAWDFYVEQVHEMDTVIENLTKELSSYSEPTILVLYGDHLPALGMENEDMKSGSIFKTQYVIWSNYGKFEKQDKELCAYQLPAEIQSRIGMSEGVLTVLHQNRDANNSYQADLHMLQYDMLYGKKYIYGGTNPFPPTDMKMGFNPIKIDSVVSVAGKYYIKGEGFTPFSKISLDGNILDTVFVSPTVLKLQEEVQPSDAERMKVSQVEKYNSILSTTE